MARIIIDQQRCKGCLLCIKFCPRKLIRKSSKLSKQGTNFVEFISTGACLGCAQCALICPDCCIEVIK